MRVKAWLFGCVVLGLAGVAMPAAAQSGMSSAFGNTIVSNYPDGGWVKHFFNPDGAYTAHFSDGRRITARWRVEGRNVCLTHIRPSMMIPRFCSRMVEAEVGQTWTARDPLGRRVRNTLIAGRNI